MYYLNVICFCENYIKYTIFYERYILKVYYSFFCEDGYTEPLFLVWVKGIFLWVSLNDRKNTCFFLCVCFFFLCGYPHRKISFNLGERDFSVRVRPTEKLFLTANRQKNSIFLSFYFCVLFSDGTPSEKYFSVGIRIFLWVFAHTGVFKFPVVHVSTPLFCWTLILHSSSLRLHRRDPLTRSLFKEGAFCTIFPEINFGSIICQHHTEQKHDPFPVKMEKPWATW